MIGPFGVGQIEKLSDRGAPSLSELAGRLRGDLLAEGARKERERLIEEIATMIEAEALAASLADPPYSAYVVLSDLARRAREKLHG